MVPGMVAGPVSGPESGERTRPVAPRGITRCAGRDNGDMPEADEPVNEPARTTTREADLEPLHLIARSDAVLRMGALMLASGTGSFRVQQAMGRVARAIGIDSMHAQVGLTDIVATTTRGPIFRTQVTDIPTPGVDANRIALLERIWRGIEPGTTVAELNRELDRIEATPKLYRPIGVVGAAALACCGFAFLNNGTWTECLAVAVAAAIGKAVQILLSRRHLNTLGVVMLSGLVACASFVGGIRLLEMLPHGGPLLHDAAFTSAILFLVPGFPLIAAALDLARLDIQAGVARMVYAVLVLLSASFGAWIVAGILDLAPSPEPPLDLPASLRTVLWLVASFAGVFGFAVTFNTPIGLAVLAAGIGAVANVPRLWLIDGGLADQAAAGLATFAVGVLAHAVTRRIAAPRITLSVPAVLIMIPGAPIYRALVFFHQDQIGLAVENGVQAVFIVMSLAVGLAIARMVTDPQWTRDRPY